MKPFFILKISSIVFLALWVTTTLRGGTSDAPKGIHLPSIEYFPDEKVAMDKLTKEPNETNAKTLAAIRFKYAATLYAYSKEYNSRDLFELSLLYAVSVVQLDASKFNYWFFLGKLYSEIESQGAILALAPLQNALKINPNSFEAEYLLGLCYAQIDEHVNAVIHFEKAVNINPKKLSNSVVQVMVYSYAKEPQLVRGIRFFKQLIKTDKATAYTKISLAILLRKYGNLPKAKNMLKIVYYEKETSERERKLAKYLLEFWSKRGDH